MHRDSLLPMVAAATLIAALAILLGLANRGFSLTDEAFYIFWIGSPARFEYSIQPFGLFFHPFFDLFQRSIVALRVLGVLMLAGSGALLGWTLARYCRQRLGIETSPAALAMLGAVFQLTYYVLWIPTPSYNLLANVGAAMIFAGCLGWLTPSERPRTPHDWAYSVLVGLGGCYAFFGKPTFAAVGGLAAFAVLLGAAWGAWSESRKTLVIRAAIAGATSVVPLYLHIIYVMPVPAFITTIEGGMAALNYGNSLLDLPLKTFTELKGAPRLLVVSGLALLIAGGWRLWKPSARSRGAEIAAALLLAVNAWFLGVAIWTVAFENRMYWDAFGPELESLILAQITFGLVRRSSDRIDPRALVLLLALVALPFAAAFGTANPLVRQISISMFGAMLASAVAAVMLFRRRTAQLIQCTLALVAMALIAGAAMDPYRVLEPFPRQTEPLAIPMFQGRLLVDERTQAYASYMKAVGQKGGLSADIPVLDLSGGGPGTALFLGGRTPGNPWLIHFFDNAEPMADAYWRTLGPADRARAWIIGPIHPKFAGSAVGRQIAAARSRYTCTGSASMTFWIEPMRVTVWKPVSEAARRSPSPAECAGADLNTPAPL